MKFLSALLFLAVGWTAQANQPAAVLPFRIINEHIHFKLSVNGEELDFIFDTGAAGNVLAKNTATELGMEVTGRQSVQGASGSTVIELSSGHEIQIADITFTRVNFMVMNLDHLQDEDSPLDGIVGAQILNRFVVELNYDESTIRLYERDDFEAPQDWEKQRISLQGFGIPVVTANVSLPNGETLTGPYLVDTGAATTVKFNTPFVNRNELIDKLGDHYDYSSRTLSKTATDEVSRLPAYEVFGHKFEDFTVRLSQGKNGVSGMSQVDGILGLSILKRFNTIYDYYNQTMYLKPNTLYDSKFRTNHDGLKIKKENGGFEVEKVYDESAAALAGIEAGDQITALDGRNDFTRHEFHNYIEEAKKSVEITLTRNGREMKMKLKPKAML